MSTQSIIAESLEPRRVFSSSYELSNLSSDGSVHSNYIDKKLIDPRGMVADQFGIRIADHGSSNSTDYNGHGKKGGPIGHIPGAQGAADGTPTGIVRNLTGLFPMTSNGITSFSKYILVNEDGGIIGYNDLVTSDGILQVDNSAKGAVYEGDALAYSGGAPYVYAVDAHNKQIDVFDANFQPAQLAGDFTDPDVPSDYAPFNIGVYGDQLFIAYSKAQTAATGQVAGAGLGIVSEFNTDGTFVKRFATGGTLNAPWGMAWATQQYGSVKIGDMLVANHGDGSINVFDSAGKSRGPLKDHGGKVIQIDGLWGLTFGNDLNGVRKDRVYFTAGPHQGHHGLYGDIKVYGTALPPKTTAAALTPAAMFSSIKIADDLKDILA